MNAAVTTLRAYAVNRPDKWLRSKGALFLELTASYFPIFLQGMVISPPVGMSALLRLCGYGVIFNN